MTKIGADPRLSALKLLAAFGVVVVHTSMTRALNVDVHSWGWWFAALSDAAGRIGSASFAMVAGAVLLGRPSENDPWGFVAQRVSRVLPALVFWSCFYFAWRMWLGEDLTTTSILRDVVQGSPMFHLWFMYMILGMYFIMPGLRFCILGVGDRSAWLYLLLVSGVLTWMASAAETLQHTMHSSFIGLVPLFVTYVLGGYYLMRKPLPVSTVMLMGGGLASIGAMGVGIALTYPYLKDWTFILFYSNRSPFAMLLTFSVFALFMRCPKEMFPRWVNPLGKATLGVYAIHPFWMGVLSQAGWGVSSISNDWFLHCVVVFILSMVSSLALCALPGLRRLAS